MTDFNLENSDFLDKLSCLAECSIDLSPADFLQILPKKVCEYLAIPVCILWIVDDTNGVYKILVTGGNIDDEYKETELDINNSGVQFSSEQKVYYLRDISRETYRLADKEQLIQRGYKSLLSSPLSIENRVVGILDIYTKNIRQFETSDKKLFLAIAQYATLAYQKLKLAEDKLKLAEDNIHKKQNLDSLNKKLRKLSNIMLEIINTSKTKEIYKLLLEGALQLVEPAKVAIFKLNYRTGKLKLVKSNDKIEKKKMAIYGEDVIGKALENNKPRILKDIDAADYIENRYIPYWHNSKSALVIPIVINKVQIRIGKEIAEGSKPIGVLILESFQKNRFKPEDLNLLISLSCHSAIEIERIRTQNKLVNLRTIEQKIANEKSYEKIMQAVLKGIGTTLKFELVNISLVNPERTRIKSEYVSGISEERKYRFKSIANHVLSSDDIQANIVRNKEIEVPAYNDKRFDKKVYQEFDHSNFIRVFLPMLDALNDLVIGTVEAGYNRKYQQFIYEWDVQILESFVNVAVQALERRKSGWLDCITHELKSPIVGMRANASFLQRRFNQIDKSLIYIKLNDIITDSEMLQFQIRQLESYWRGRNYRKEKIERIYLNRDIILKTIYQLKSLANEKGFPISNILVPVNNHTIIYTDKIKLNQIVYNLLINAIKYARNDPEKFKIVVEIETDGNQNLQVRFKDWGIGIDENHREKIFEEGFRELSGIQKNVSGSGLGLFISRAIAREMKGDLEIDHFFHPTEFVLTVHNHKF